MSLLKPATCLCLPGLIGIPAAALDPSGAPKRKTYETTESTGECCLALNLTMAL